MTTTFTEKQQTAARKAFIEEQRQKAWDAACRADWLGTQSDELLASYQKLQTEDLELEASIKALDNVPDYHTKDNRDKRKAQQERRNILSRQMQAIQQSASEAQQSMAQLYAMVEHNLAMAKHAETWEWKEAVAAAPNESGAEGLTA